MSVDNYYPSNSQVRKRAFLLVTTLLILVGITGYFVIKDSQQRLIEHQAVTVAEIVARQAAAARSVYASDIIAKVKADATGFADIDYHKKDGALPLPAQFLKAVANRASADSDGLYQYRPVSKWNLEISQGLNGAFLEWAWKELERQDQSAPTQAINWKPAYLIRQFDDKETLLYLRADPASAESCVKCHNDYEQTPEIIERRKHQGLTPGKTFKQHQLLGAIFVQIPIDKIQTLALKETTQIIAWIIVVLTAGLVVLAGFLLGYISKAKEVTKQLFWQAHHDSLTHLPNRNSFEEKAEQLIEQIQSTSETHAMCYLDLDQFKLVNDTCGHAAGDHLLRQIAGQLREVVRTSDMLARLGGDEFGILLENCPIERAQIIAESICSKVKNYHFIWEGHNFDIGVSIGVVPINSHSENVIKVMSHADVACYSAKEAGRNRVQVYREDDEELAFRTGEMSWVSRILNAIEQDRIVIYCQKIQPIKNQEEYVHYEILSRLIDEDGNLVPPMEFLPAAERYNLIDKIDLTVIKRTFDAIRKGCFDNLSNNGFISINLSGQSLSDKHFLEQVMESLDHYQIDPRQLCFEITESMAIANLGAVKEFMFKLKKLGVRFALDDFGTGLCSLTYLKQLPVDYLKIDGSFIRDIVDDPIDRTLVKAINQMAHTMGLKTVAEYVETEDILNLIGEMQIDYAQGYYIHKPSIVNENDND